MVEHAQEFGHPARPAFDHAAAQIGKALEHAVIDHRGEEFLGGEPQAQEIGEAQILPAAVQVRRALAPVVLELGGLRFRARADMQHEGDPVVLQILPERIEIGVAGALVACRARAEHHRLRARLDGALRLGEAALGIVQRSECHAVHAAVSIAEILLRLVERRRGGIALVVAFRLGDRPQAEGREHQLPLEAQPVERLDPLVLVEPAVAQPALGPLDGVFQRLGARFGIALTRLRGIDHLHDPVAAFALGIHLRIHLLVLALQIGGEPVLRFHRVRIGVVYDLTLLVRVSIGNKTAFSRGN